MAGEDQDIEDPRETTRLQGKRLKEARLRKGLVTIRETAVFLGVGESTYVNHETGERSMHREVNRYARMLGVDPEWLMYGVTCDKNKGLAVIEGSIVQVTAHVLETSPKFQGGETLELPPGAPEGARAIVIVGPGLAPVYKDGNILIYWADELDPTPYVGLDCMFWLLDGDLGFLGRVERGSRPGYWNVHHVATGALTMIDVQIRMISPIEIVLRRRDWRQRPDATQASPPPLGRRRRVRAG